MPYAVERISGEPIVLVSLSSDFDVQKDQPPATRETLELVEEIGVSPVYIIMDTSEYEIGFSDLVAGLVHVTKGNQALFTDPRVRLAIVGAKGLVEMGIQSLTQTQYGGVSVQPFRTVEEALDYARQEIAQG